MLSYQNGIVKTSVRRLVEFVLRQGNIETSSAAFSQDTEVMQAGSRIHRKIQKSQDVSYRAEVSLKMEWDERDYHLLIEGRADGIAKKQDLYYIDEIKGMMRDITELTEAEPLHLSQAKCYAYMFAKQEGLEKIGVQITYCNLESEEINRIWYQYTIEELEQWFEKIRIELKKWSDFYVMHRKERKKSLKELKFPFEYRDGQKKLSALVYRAIQKKQQIFLQAPTGVGKTISTVYPSLKAMGEEEAERIFYLTAKTITRTVANDTLLLLKEQNLAIKSITITAKEKICPNETFECDPDQCEMARGHFDRINEALYDLLKNETIADRETILHYASKYRVCPYELSFEAAAWDDFIICDYNYVFDPTVSRGDLVENTKQIYLIDEAHNLLDRAREMYSAKISLHSFLQMKKWMKGKRTLQRRLNSCKKVLEQWRQSMEQEHMIRESVDELYFPLLRLCNELSDYFKDHPIEENREEILEVYFSWRFFVQCMETMDEGYEIYEESENGDYWVKLFCINPANQLRDKIGQGNTAVFFSATLLPITYYKKLLSDESARAYAVPSPFPVENCLRVIANDVTSRYRARGQQTYEKIVNYLEKTIEIKSGNYMIFFPSYEMMEATFPIFEKSTLALFCDVIVQNSEMSEHEREEFLNEFREDREKSMIAFCVLGSIFAEGIDLTGERLTGVFIVGTGLPGLSYEREVISQYFDRTEEKGYDYAYRYPGIHKVLQAAGRVIRTADDVGMIVLMDDRFLWRENLNLLSDDWNQYYETNFSQYETILKHFWCSGTLGEI